ncbi:MAG TPA: peptide ABC transporter substrate-binding protein, partial [Gammaproteobacteria bacterium]|nr:peptide ABC transporter substrate-binding protein [Gammaproteobacteria bacterium]
MTSAVNPNNVVQAGNEGSSDFLVQIRNLKMYFPVTEGAIVQRVVAQVKAVDGISLEI